MSLNFTTIISMKYSNKKNITVRGIAITNLQQDPLNTDLTAQSFQKKRSETLAFQKCHSWT